MKLMLKNYNLNKIYDGNYFYYINLIGGIGSFIQSVILAGFYKKN
jgi:hypothetical protein